MASFGYPNLPPIETAELGALMPIAQLAMSIMCAPQSGHQATGIVPVPAEGEVETDSD
jgi:hypothetical protein